MVNSLKKKETNIISDELIQEIQDRLSEGKQVRRTLPLEGRLHIDRTLPFLVVYRRPLKPLDKGTDQLVKGEASYLIASSSPQLKSSLSKLIRTIVNTLSREYGAFLIIEMWSGGKDHPESEITKVVPKPGFRIITSTSRPPTKTVEILEKSLKRIKILKQPTTVALDYNKDRAPVGLTPLISSTEARKLNCFVIGLEVQPIYQNPTTGEIYPLVLRTLHRRLARTLKQAVFEFSHNQTSHRPPNYQALGRRAVVKAVWEVDSQLAEISNSFDFLLQVTPVNTDSAWTSFKQSHFEQIPVLYYRPLPVAPELLKRQLYQIHIERVEDPTLAFLFREKRMELDRQLTMLPDRGNSAFLYGSLQLFGGVSTDLLELAKNILHNLPPHSRNGSGGTFLNAYEFAERARSEIDYYRHTYSKLSSTVQVRDDTVGLMVSRGNLLIGKQTSIPLSRVDALLQHEVGTHIVTYFNGRSQPFRQLYCGLPGYEALQEGLAVLAEYLVGGLSPSRMRLLAGRVVAAHYLITGASFVETFRELHDRYGFNQRTAFTTTIRIYRGGGFVKDAVYLRGLVDLLKYLERGYELEPLFVGKIATDHIPIIRELQYRHVLQPVPLRPRYVENPQISAKLTYLKGTLTPLNLIERSIK
jgi:uncharacterized protein (TIGR02421 family)